MKKGYFGTYVKTILIILVIIGIIASIIYFMKNELDSEQFETIKTDMLLIEGKTKVVAEKVRIKEKGVSYVGRNVKEMTEELEIKQLQERNIIDLEEKESNYYALDKSNLKELGLSTINLKEGYYIVDYKNSEVIYSKGIKDSNGNILYKLSEILK